jgi:hypothetical protein
MLRISDRRLASMSGARAEPLLARGKRARASLAKSAASNRKR